MPQNDENVLTSKTSDMKKKNNLRCPKIDHSLKTKQKEITKKKVEKGFEGKTILSL